MGTYAIVIIVIILALGLYLWLTYNGLVVLKQRIKEAEDNIAKNKTQLEKKKQEFDAQKKVVDEFTAKEKAVE